MSTLLIELAGAQQSWGSRSRFAVRATELAPTKSGVIGLIAAALGMERSASLERFEGLRFGVRIDQPGHIERDFQTARSLDGRTAFPLSQRYYIADAVFLAALEGSDSELTTYRDAIARPRFPIFLGRRAFPPDGPVPTWIVPDSLDEALDRHPWLAHSHHRRHTPGETVSLQVVRDAAPGEEAGETRADVPVSFDPRRRRYDARDVTVRWTSVAHPDPYRPTPPLPARPPLPPRHGDPLLGSPTSHDPERLLADEEV